jgi:two-component system sensor histidine kinase DctS
MTPNTRPDWARALLQRSTSWWHGFEEALPGGRGRRSLWLALIALVMGVLITLVWLAGRYEASQLQAELESDTTEAVSDLRRQLARQTQSLQGLQSNTPTETFWNTEAHALLPERAAYDLLRWVSGMVYEYARLPQRIDSGSKHTPQEALAKLLGS